jgi:hypothetical protein
MGRTISGAMVGTDIRKFHEGTLPLFDYGYKGYTGKMQALPNLLIHIPGSDSDSDEAYNEDSDS